MEYQLLYLNILQLALKSSYYERCAIHTWILARGISKESGGWTTYEDLLQEIQDATGVCEKTATTWISKSFDYLSFFDPKNPIKDANALARADKKKIKVHSIGMTKLCQSLPLQGNYAARFEAHEYRVPPRKFKALCWAAQVQIFIKKKRIKNNHKSYISDDTGEVTERVMSHGDHCYNPKTLNQCAHSISSKITNTSVSESSRLKHIAKENKYIDFFQQYELSLRYQYRILKKLAQERAEILDLNPKYVVWSSKLECFMLYYPCKYFPKKEIFSYTPAKSVRKRCLYINTSFEWNNTIPMDVCIDDNMDYFSFC